MLASLLLNTDMNSTYLLNLDGDALGLGLGLPSLVLLVGNDEE